MTGHEIAHALANHTAERMSIAMASQAGVLAAGAGYDPAAAVTLWQKMAAVGGEGPPAFLSTHPTDQQRLAALVPKMRPYYQATGVRPRHPVRMGNAALS